MVRQKGSALFAIYLKSEILTPTEKRFVVLQEDEGLSVTLMQSLPMPIIGAGWCLTRLVSLVVLALSRDPTLGFLRLFVAAPHVLVTSKQARSTP